MGIAHLWVGGWEDGRMGEGGEQSTPTASFSSFRLLVKTAHLHQHPVATSTFFLFLSRNRANHRHQRRKEKKHFLVLFIFLNIKLQ